MPICTSFHYNIHSGRGGLQLVRGAGVVRQEAEPQVLLHGGGSQLDPGVHEEAQPRRRGRDQAAAAAQQQHDGRPGHRDQEERRRGQGEC